MTVCLFVGPTLSQTEVAAVLDAVCLPPVAQGDVLRALDRFAPRAIGIVDGLFGGAPAVWHKEILWALSQGVAVYGSASMGALRAAELFGFGMQGVGRIFEAYRDGTVEDDDEVALVHGPAELGHPALSEPMVNVRATLAAAEATGVLDARECDAVAADAKALFFAERTWPAILDRTGAALGPAGRARFEAWLPAGAVDRKRADALEMLAAMRGDLYQGTQGLASSNLPPAAADEKLLSGAGQPFAPLAAGCPEGADEGSSAGAGAPHPAYWPPSPRNAGRRGSLQRLVREVLGASSPNPPFRLVETHHWRSLVARIAAEDVGPDEQRVLDELRVGPQALMRDMRTRALAGHAALHDAEPGPEDSEAASDALRDRLGLYNRAALDAWLAAAALTAAAFGPLALRWQRGEHLRREAAGRLSRPLLDELRLGGHYPTLAARAAAKADALAQAGLAAGSVVNPAERVALREGFAARRLDGADASLAALLDATGFADADTLDQALRREHLYLTLARPAPEA